MPFQKKKDKLQRMWMACVLIEEYIATNYGCGGNLHIILDDGNYRDADVNLCHVTSTEKGDVFGMNICQILGSMKEEERRAIVENSYIIENVIKRDDC